jgi:alpha-1,3-rhamnosyl/mannosyltransferase
MMRVGIDVTALLPQATGVDNYLTHLVLALGRVDRVTRYTVFTNAEDRRLFAGALPPNFTIVPACLRGRPVRLVFQQALLPAAARALGLDVLHSPSFLMPLVRGRQRHLLTVYDMTMFTMPGHHTLLRRSRLFLRGVSASIRRTDLVSVPSEAVRQDLLALMPDVPPDRVRVIVPGVGEEFRPAPDGRPVRPRPYVLFVGTLEPRKSVETLAASYRQLVAEGDLDEELVLAGRVGWNCERLFAQLEAPELRGRVHRLGYVPQAELVRLYAGARLFVYPSLREGFGFPPLEALASGIPTITTDSSAMAENLRGAAELVPAGDVQALTAAMRRLLRDPALRTERRARGLERAARFRWEETARQTRACYEELADRR